MYVLCYQGPESTQGTRHHFTKGGRLVANKQIVYTITEDKGLQPVGCIPSLLIMAVVMRKKLFSMNKILITRILSCYCNNTSIFNI